MNISDYIEYANTFEASSEVMYWIEHTLKNYLEKHKASTEEVEHTIDYLVQNEVKKLNQMSYEQAVKKSQIWSKELQKKASEIKESPEDIKTVLDFKDGFKIVQLIGENAYKREGYLMSHCVASYFGKDTKIYSLRDRNNNPHCTMEHGQQIKGKGNGDIHPKYIEYVVKFLEFTGMNVRDSDMAHLGYKVVEFPEYTKTPLYKKRYAQKDQVIVYSDNVEVFDSPSKAEEYSGKKKVLLRGNHMLKTDTIWRKIQQVGGYLSINSNAELKNLKTVGGDLYIYSNAELKSLKTVGGYLSINSKIDKRTAFNLLKYNSKNKWYLSKKANGIFLNANLKNVEYKDIF